MVRARGRNQPMREASVIALDGAPARGDDSGPFTGCSMAGTASTKRPTAGSARRSTRQAETGEPTAGVGERVREALGWLESRGTKKNRDGMARYAIVAPKAFGVSMTTMQQLAKRLGRDHELAVALWETEWYEARMLTAFVDEPLLVTAAQMDRWAREFDNWAVCDTLCFHLFDRTPHAWRKIEQWSDKRAEFVKRAAFALLASVALHDKTAPDAPFLRALPLVERAATDERNFVRKGVSWALRSIGGRNRLLNDAAVATAERLASTADRSARWVGGDARRGLLSAATRKRLASRR
jgi:3-methyladenine DNA glycosylase AlkD